MLLTRRRAARLLLATGLLAVALRKLALVTRFQVEGASMEPSYRDGDRVLVSRLAYRFRRPQPGDVVVVRDPERLSKHLLKRVGAGPEGANDPWAVWVVGDNAEASRDSRTFGAVSVEDIVGKAVMKY